MCLRERELGQVVLLLEREIDCVRDGQRVLDDLGVFREARSHLFRAFEVQPLVVLHAVRVVPVLTEPDAQKDVVRFVVFRFQEV